jgi:hypothetical protein
MTEESCRDYTEVKIERLHRSALTRKEGWLEGHPFLCKTRKSFYSCFRASRSIPSCWHFL